MSVIIDILATDYVGDSRTDINSNFSNLNTDKAEKSNVLELNNTDAFTPDTDYEPATKKYVDDNVVAGGVSSVNTQTGAVVLDADDIDDSSTTHKFVTATDLTTLSNTSGANTGDQSSGDFDHDALVNTHNLTTDIDHTTISNIGSNSHAQIDIDLTRLVNTSGTNTGDQSSIVGISGTKAEFNTACSDGTFAYSGGAFHDGFSDFVANEHIDWTNATDNFSTSGSITDGIATLSDGSLTALVNTSQTGYSDFTEISAPASPSANDGRLYAKDDGGTTKLYFKDSAGTETDLLAGGGGTPGGSDTQIQYNDSSSFAGITNLTTDGTDVTLLDAGKLKIGTGGDGEIYSSGDDVYIHQKTQDKDIILKVNAGGTDTEILRIDGSTSRVGVGTTTPSTEFHIHGEVTISSTTTTDRFTFSGPNMLLGTDADTDAYIRIGAFFGTNNIDTKNRDFRIFGTNDTTGMYFDESAGSFGFGTTSPSHTLTVDGSFMVQDGSDEILEAEAGGAIYMPYVYNMGVGATTRDPIIDDTGKLGYQTSSVRYKENIEDYTENDWIYSLRPVKFDYKEAWKGLGQLGLIAEEVEDVNPNIVSYNDNETPETVNYSKLITPLLKEVQRLNNRISKLEGETTKPPKKAKIPYVKQPANPRHAIVVERKRIQAEKRAQKEEEEAERIAEEQENDKIKTSS